MKTRQWAKLLYHDPERVLKGLKELAQTLPLDQMPYETASLRTHDLKPYGQSRQCALLCYGIGQVLGLKVRYADVEQSDYDCIAHYRKDDVSHFVPVQMKEFVPEHVNPTASLQSLIEGLTKYKDSQDLVVAVHLNRAGTVKLSELHFPPLNIGELWFFGANSPDQSRWTIMGNLLKPNAQFHEFTYPGV